MIARVKGTADVRSAELAVRDRLTSQLRVWFESHGYEGVDLPIIEPTDLYLRKAGSELLTKLYTFAEPGGQRVSLRPEFTASVVRSFLEDPVPLPARWHYSGPVFRFDRGSTLRQLTQQGVEYLGASGVDVDGDLVRLAYGGLQTVGITETAVVLGHVGVIAGAIQGLGLSERTSGAILASISHLTRPGGGPDALRERLAELGVASAGSASTELRAALQGLGEDSARVVIRGVLEGVNVDLLGAREPDEIVGRLLKKLAGWDDLDRIEDAIALVSELAAISGEPDEALGRAAALLSGRGLASGALDDLRTIVDRLSPVVSAITIDFGLMRDLGYYTGLVFELRNPHHELPIPLGGGGRYDGLIRVFGGDDIPAAGFTYYTDALCPLVSGAEAAR